MSHKFTDDAFYHHICQFGSIQQIKEFLNLNGIEITIEALPNLCCPEEVLLDWDDVNTANSRHRLYGDWGWGTLRLSMKKDGKIAESFFENASMEGENSLETMDEVVEMLEDCLIELGRK